MLTLEWKISNDWPDSFSRRQKELLEKLKNYLSKSTKLMKFLIQKFAV